MARMKALAEIVEGLKAKVYAFDNLSPVSRVSVYVKAGSRYEPNAVPGIAHFLKASAGITTELSSHLAFIKHLERTPAKLTVTLEREYLVYRVECLREKLGFALQFVDHQLNRPEFRSWELFDLVQPKLKLDLKFAKKNQALLVNEALHKAAYRGGLAHSTLIPEHQIDKIKNHHLFDYVETNVLPSNITIVGIGTNGEKLSSIVNDFQFRKDAQLTKEGNSRYVGGEARIQAGFNETLVNYVVEGAAADDFKMIAALEVLANILGGCHQKYVKYGSGAGHSLSYLLSKSNLSNVKPNVININHSDTGLFGISLLGPNSSIGSASRLAVKHVKSVLTNVSESDLKAAKEVTLKRSAVLSEDQEAAYLAISRRCLAGLEDVNPSQVVASLTLKDIQSAVAKLLKSKPTLVSVGNPRYVPYVDEIDS